MFKPLKKGGKSPLGEVGLGHDNKRKHTVRPGFFRTAGLFTCALLASALITLAVPKASYSQEKGNPAPESVKLDTLGVSLQLEGGILTMLRNGKPESFDIRDSVSRYSSDASASLSSTIIDPVITEMPKLGTGAVLVFSDWAVACFPDAPAGLTLRFISSPGGKPFYRNAAKFRDGTVLLLNEDGMAGYRYNMKFSNSFDGAKITGPSMQNVASEKIDAVDLLEVQAGISAVTVRVTSGERKGSDGRIRSGLYPEVIPAKGN